MESMKEKGFEGEYVCHHCHIIYCVYGSRCECDLCGRKLRWADNERLKELEAIWASQEHRKGLSPDFAYSRRTIGDRLLGLPATN